MLITSLGNWEMFLFLIYFITFLSFPIHDKREASKKSVSVCDSFQRVFVSLLFTFRSLALRVNLQSSFRTLIISVWTLKKHFFCHSLFCFAAAGFFPSCRTNLANRTWVENGNQIKIFLLHKICFHHQKISERFSNAIIRYSCNKIFEIS